MGPEAPQFAQTSLKYLHLDHPLRRACIRSFLYLLPSPTLLSIRILLNPYFERLTMTVIMINCVTLGMYQPCEDSGFCDRKCQILKVTQKNWKSKTIWKMKYFWELSFATWCKYDLESVSFSVETIMWRWLMTWSTSTSSGRWSSRWLPWVWWGEVATFRFTKSYINHILNQIYQEGDCALDWALCVNSNVGD